MGNTSIVEIFCAAQGYQIHALPSLAPVIALAVSALITVTAVTTVRTHETPTTSNPDDSVAS